MSTELERAVQSSKRLNASTKQRYLRVIRAFLAFAGEEPAAWTRRSGERFYGRLLQHTSVLTANRQMTALRFAARKCKLDLAMVRLRSLEQRTAPRALSFVDAQLLLRACKDDNPFNRRDTAILWLWLTTGMSCRAMARIDLADLNQSCMQLQARSCWEQYSVPLSTNTQVALLGWADWLTENGVTSGPLFRSLQHATHGRTTAGPGLTEQGFYQLLRACVKRAGITNVRVKPRTFRVSILAWAKEYGWDRDETAAVLGFQLPVRDGQPVVDAIDKAISET